MKKLWIVLVLAAAVALAIACVHTRKPPAGEASFHSPIQPLDRGVLSSIPSGRRDFRRDPPLVQDVVARPIGGGSDLRLEVRFAEAQLPKTLTIQTESEPVTLRDDGKNGDAVANDRLFTAITTLPPEFLRDRAEVVASLEQSQDRQGVFRDRQIVPIRDLVAQISRDQILSPFDFPGKFFLTTVPSKSLMIVDPAVVNDPTRAGNPCVSGSNAMGPWSFGFLMNEMVSGTGITGSQFVEDWLNQWAISQPINGPNVPARPNVNSMIINPWRTASGGGSSPLDLAKAPFHLLAIVNRLDLGDNPGYGGSANAGELRFVFGLLNGCSPTRFAVILEYGVPPKSCPQTRTLAQSWQALSGMTIGTPAYNAALQALTDPVVAHGAAPGKPNGSAINQVRTNELHIGSPWELREFRIDASSPRLRETTVKQNPIASFNNTGAVASYVNTFQTDILLRRHIVPLQFPSGTPFLAGNAPVPPSFWNAPGIVNNNARNLFSLSTCNGCHAGETNTTFVHVEPNTPIGSPAALSGFLTGITVMDPGDGVTPRTYNDLLDRKNKLNAKASSPCLIIALFNQTLRMVH